MCSPTTWAARCSDHVAGERCNDDAPQVLRQHAPGRLFLLDGYTTEASDGGGGIACTALALGKILANLCSDKRALSQRAMNEILTPPAHYRREPNFDPASSKFYSKGFNVAFSGGQPWFGHSGMTQHCGGIIGDHSGYQYIAVSNWNNAASPYVDVVLGRALKEAVGKLG